MIRSLLTHLEGISSLMFSKIPRPLIVRQQNFPTLTCMAKSIECWKNSLLKIVNLGKYIAYIFHKKFKFISCECLLIWPMVTLYRFSFPNCLIGFNERPLKTMKNVFYSILKAFSFSIYLNICIDFLVM